MMYEFFFLVICYYYTVEDLVKECVIRCTMVSTRVKKKKVSLIFTTMLS